MFQLGDKNKARFKQMTSRNLIVSPVPSLFSSNRAPTQSEVTIIQEYITSAEEASNRLQSPSTQVTAQGTSKLQKLLEKHEFFIQAHISLLSTFRSLPTDILSVIFLHVAEADDLKTHKAPWVLGQVCQQWRYLALATPALWKHLPPIHLGTLNPKEVKRLVKSLSILLHRSSGTTISFHLLNFFISSLDMEILDLLFDHSHRWETISLKISGASLQRFAPLRGKLHSLRSLTFEIQRTTKCPIEFLEIAPKLTEVKVAVLPHEGMLHLPWSQLTTYEEASFNLHGLAKILSSSGAPKLRYLHFTVDHYPVWGQVKGVEDVVPITLPALTFLTFQSLHPQHSPVGLIDKLTASNVRHVVFRSFSVHDFALELESFILRSTCLLQSLTFHSNTPHSNNLISILKLSPTLMTLDINSPSIELSTSLLDKDESGWLLVPHLHTLTIYLDNTWNHFSIFLKVVTARHEPQMPKLKRLGNLKAFKLISQKSEDYFTFAGLLLASSSTKEMSVIKGSLKEYLDLRAILKQSNTFHVSTSKRRRQQKRLLENRVSKLESLEVTEQNVQLVHISNIDYLLLHTLFEADLIPSHKKALQQRIISVAQRWNLVLADHAASMKWRWDAEGFLVYVPENDGSQRPTPIFRGSREFSFCKTLPALSLFWPVNTS